MLLSVNHYNGLKKGGGNGDKERNQDQGILLFVDGVTTEVMEERWR